MADINPTVVEIRCPCRQDSFYIRTAQERKERPCNLCMRSYIVRVYANGAVTVHFIQKFGVQEEPLGRERFSVVTEGE